jgi:outer membrane protein assembly factor BamB
MNAGLFAVIPTFVILGPVALLAALLAAVLGRVHSGLRRWSVVFAVAATDALLYLGHIVFREDWRGSWLGSPFALWVMLTSATLAGAVWAWRSSRQAEMPEQVDRLRPGLGAMVAIGLIALLGMGLVLLSQQEGYPLFHPSLVIWATAWLSAAYLIFLRLLWSRPGVARVLLPAPVAVLGILALNCGLYGTTTLCADRALVWSFPAEDKGNILSRPVVSGEHVYVTVAMNGSGGDLRWGIVYCLDRSSGEKRWSFTDGRQLRPVRSSPYLAGNLLYVGDGLPDSPDGSLCCLDAATGEKQWQFRTNGPVASDPSFADGRIFISAGRGGVYCLDAATGARLWQFDQFVTNCSPAVRGGSAYVGGVSGGQDELICLDAATGHPLWRTAVDLPVQAINACTDDLVVTGLGNGTLTRSAEQPAGAVVCLEARTGRRLWRYDVGDGVLAQPVVNEGSVYFVSRDRYCYALDYREGKPRWACELGSPVVAAPFLAGSYLLVASSEGIVYRLRADTGEFRGSYDLAKYTRTKTVAVLVADCGRRPRLVRRRPRRLAWWNGASTLLPEGGPWGSLICTCLAFVRKVR